MVHFKLFGNRINNHRTQDSSLLQPPPSTSSSSSSTTSSSPNQRRRLSIKHLIFRPQQQPPPPPTPPIQQQQQQQQQQSEQLEILNSPTNEKLRRSLSLSTNTINTNNNNNRRSVSENNLYNLPTNTNPSSSFLNEPPSSPNPLSIITSKLLPNKTHKLTHKSSVISLVESLRINNHKNSTTTTPTSPTNFSLKSFRNVRTPPSPPTNSITNHPSTPPPLPLSPPPPPPPTTTTNTTTTKTAISRPPSIASISRPSSPSSKISAAAFREARAARNSRASISSSFSDITSIPNINFSETNPTIKHARFQSSPNQSIPQSPSANKPSKNYSSFDHHQQHHLLRQQQRIASLGVPSLISQIPDRPGVSPIKPFESNNNTLYTEHDILVPPRPAFYGSKMSGRSMSSDQSPSRQSYGAPKRPSPSSVHRSSFGAGLYANPLASHSTASIRSVPVHSTRLRSTTTSNTPSIKHTPQGQDPRHLDQWHSDDEDEPRKTSQVPQPIPRANHHNHDDDDDEDSVPLSKLKKKSVGSLRDAVLTASAAQTLARTRQQLHSSTFSFSHSSSRSVTSSASVDDRRSSVVSSRSAIDGSRTSRLTTNHNLHLTSSSPLKAIQTNTISTHPRGNSPASSSSGSGSGSGSWNFPLTPRDSFLPTPVHHHHPAFNLLNPGYLLPIPPSSTSSATPNPSNLLLNQSIRNPGSSSVSPSPIASFPTTSNVGSDGQTFINGSDVVSGVPGVNGSHEGRETATGYWNNGAPTANGLNDLPTPVGVDPYLYAGLDHQQKIALHQRSQLILQMMAVQAQTAAQMHALSGPNNAGSSYQGPRRATVHHPASFNSTLTTPDQVPTFAPFNPRQSPPSS